MPRPKDEPERVHIQEIKARLAALTARLQKYESQAARTNPGVVGLVSDGLRLSQEVEILRREIEALRKENLELKARLANRASDQGASS